MINIKVILKSFGLLLLIESMALFLFAITSLIYEGSDFLALIQSTLISGIIGGIIYFLLRKTNNDIGKREGYIIITFVWIILTIFGILPFLLSDTLPFDLAFFEVLSGVTTTGASIITDPLTLPHGLLLWRSMTQWLGGMVILLFSLAILPTLGIGGVQMYSISSVNKSNYEIHPKVKETAKKCFKFM
ncbi:MAG: hypothetical protein IPO21_05940 [Bacteroidales bacterium]|nr:hypothetical protein [Bacteroidales bacterium]